MKKRLMSFALSGAMLLSLLPTAALTAFATETVTYERKGPEVAILNAYTGDNTAFYNLIKATQTYTNYNAAKKFVPGGYEAFIGDNVLDEGEKTFTFRDFKGSTLQSLIAPYQNLQSNFSGTYYNRWHVHKSGWLDLGKEWRVLSFMRGGLWSGNAVKQQGPINTYAGTDNSTAEEPRFGDGEFAYIPSNCKDLSLHFEKSRVTSDDRVCECGGSHVVNAIVSFKDARAPKIKNITGIAIRGVDPAREVVPTQYAPGSTIEIKIQYDEPIRFADDSNTSKDGLYIKLLKDKRSDYFEAKLTALQNDTLTFQYQIPDNYTDEVSISAIDLAPLMGKDLPLVQVMGAKQFEVENPSGSSTLGFNTTNSYITDLAGNAIISEIPGVSGRIDTKGPYVEEVSFFAATYNENIKAMLKENGATADPIEDQPDKDRSDLYLGVQDYVYATLLVNERLNVPGVGKYPTPILDEITATSNLLDRDRNPVILRAPYVQECASDQGGIRTYTTSFQFRESMTVMAGMTCTDPDGIIRIKSINVPESIKDLAGNPFDIKKLIPNTSGVHLDAIPPVVSTTQTADDQGKYTTVKEGNGFRFPITIKDAVDGSGVNGINGYFVLHNNSMFEHLIGNDRYGKNHAFEYVVTAEADLTGNETWKEGTMGSRCAFVQVDAGNVIHIRPAPGEVYSVNNSMLEVFGCDLAGNTSYEHYSKDGQWCIDNNHPQQVSAQYPLDWQSDSVAPTAELLKVNRNIQEDTGTMKVEIKLADQINLKQTFPQALWADAGASVDETTAGWTDMTGEITGNTATVTATVTVQNGGTYAQHLWIKASDSADNILVKDMGEFSYNMEYVKYALEYTSNITNKPSIKVNSLQADSTLAIVVGHGNRNVGLVAGEIYAIRLIPTSEVTGPIEALLNGNNEKWYMGTYSPDENKHTFHCTNSTTINDLSMNNRYSGDVTVTVLSVLTGGISNSTDQLSKGDIVIGNGYPVGSEVVKLRAATSYGEAQNGPALKTPTIQLADDSGTKRQPDAAYDPDNDPITRATLEGLQFKIAIEPNDGMPTWVCDNIDYANSYIQLVKYNTPEQPVGETLKIPLQERTPTQTVTVPAKTDQNGNVVDDYTSGVYTATLHVACLVGGGYEAALPNGGTGNSEHIYIDAANPINFTISPMRYKLKETQKYDYQKYGLGERVSQFQICLVEDDVTYLPTADSLSQLAIEVETGSEPQLIPGYMADPAYGGTYAVYAWNSTAGVDETASRKAANFISSDIKTTEYAFDIALVDRDAEVVGAYGTTSTTLPLIKDKLNIITIQIESGNGQKSEKRTFSVFPKTNPAVQGTLSETFNPKNGCNVVSEGDLIFTPASGQSMADIKVYGSQLKEGAMGDGGNVTSLYPREMLPQADGTYRIPLTIPQDLNMSDEDYVKAYAEGSDTYTVYAQDRYGNVTLLTQDGDPSDPYVDSVTVDTDPPVVTKTSVTVTDGTYEAVFKVSDETLWAYHPETGQFHSDWKLSLSFDEAHEKALGLSNTRLNLDISGKELAEHDGSWPHYGSDEPQFVYYAWTPESGTHETGIYDVYMTRDNYDLQVHVIGAVGYNAAEDAPAKLPAFNVNLEVTDAFGYVGTGISTVAAQANTKPYVITTGDNKPIYTKATTGFEGDMALQLHFTAPVKPNYSWIYPEPDKQNYFVAPKFATVYTDAFPITDDGTWEITYTDRFGKVWTEQLVLTDVFNDYGYQVAFSTLNPSKEPVDVWGLVPDQTSSAYLMMYQDLGNWYLPLPKTGSLDDGWDVPKKEKHATVSTEPTDPGTGKNDTYLFLQCPKDFKFTGKEPVGDRLTIHLPKTIKTAPLATPRFFFEAIGNEFNTQNLPKGETTGNVRVKYDTDRHVTPTGDTGETFTFTYGGATTHTFTYVDDFGLNGSLTVDLKTLGVTLGEPPEPPEPFKDILEPLVNVDIHAKRMGGYTQSGAFTMVQPIDKALENVSYVQGYNLKVNARDQSNFKIVLLNAPPTDLTYSNAQSDTIDGVTLNGSTITITKAVTFTVAVVDNATAQSAAPKDNVTSFTVTKEELEKWIDLVPPTAETAITKANTLYDRMGYIQFSDNTKTTVIVDSPTLTPETAEGPYKDWSKRLFTTNESIPVFFHDFAGNMGTVTFAVNDINISLPKLNISWSPCLISNQSGTPTFIYTAPTNGPVNSDVTAIVSSDTSIMSVTAEYSLQQYGGTWYPSDASELPATLPTVTQTGDKVFVRFSEGNLGVRLTVTAPNGKSAQQELWLSANVIDRTPADIGVEIDPVKRENASKPYAATITLTPNEQVYCHNYGAVNTDRTAAIYDATHPLTATVTADQEYVFDFVDLAGNPRKKTVTVALGIDRKTPVLTTDPADTSDLKPTAGSVTLGVTTDEDCTLTGIGSPFDTKASVEKSITISDNGVYTLTATDAAGNTAYKNVVVGSIDRIAPTVSFDKSTINIRQDSSQADLDTKLAEGVTVQDNFGQPTAVPDTKNLTLNTVGLYPVVYTATDAAGNQGSNTRYVRVYDKNLPVISIDGEKAEPYGTMVLKTGKHNLTVENIKKISENILEPYTVKISKGIYTVGQMKYLPFSLPIDKNGDFTAETAAFYTLYITTQSRGSFVTTLYIER